jgi:hypothetical protein
VPPSIRKITTVVEEVRADAAREVGAPLRRAAAAAVVENPWARRHVEDLSIAVRELAPMIANELSSCLLGALGGAAAIEAFGKAALVGLAGEVEHGAALIHTPHLGDRYRESVDGTSIIAFGELRAEPGTALLIPMWHKAEAATRSHYQAIEIRVADAPQPDEIVVALAASTGPRPFARIGDRTTDPQTLALEGTP